MTEPYQYVLLVFAIYVIGSILSLIYFSTIGRGEWYPHSNILTVAVLLWFVVIPMCLVYITVMFIWNIIPNTVKFIEYCSDWINSKYIGMNKKSSTININIKNNPDDCQYCNK